MISEIEIAKIRQAMACDEKRVAHLSTIFSALSDSSRFRILSLLLQCKGLCVTDIANVMGVSVPAASQQLKVLEVAGLISRERQGQRICYRIEPDNNLVKYIVKVINSCEPAPSLVR